MGRAAQFSRIPSLILANSDLPPQHSFSWIPDLLGKPENRIRKNVAVIGTFDAGVNSSTASVMASGGCAGFSRSNDVIPEPTNTGSGRDVLWSHPAFANRRAHLRNDLELVCVDLGGGQE